jgi:hypothetical protein
MKRFSTTQIWFAVTVLLFVVALVLLAGVARDVVVAVAVFGFLGACIRTIGLAVRDNPVNTEYVARRDVFHSALLSESARRRKRR